jgi:glycosyltransferase involved in cell wall biosynthesis
MSKPKLFCWNDSVTVKTGFGIVAANLFRDLHNEYDVHMLGINYYGLDAYDTTKWFIYPIDGMDPMGVGRFEKVITNVKPDKILLFQDIFNIQHVLPVCKKNFPKVPILVYFPIDGTPVNRFWRPAFDTPDKLITYTKWGINAIYDTFPHLKEKGIEYLYHGVDTNVFNPLPYPIIRKTKEDSGWGNKFLVISNNRFQPRKCLPLTMRAMALFVKGYKKCKCGNVYVATKEICDLNGCPASDVVDQKPGHDDVVIYFHASVSEKIMGPGPANTLGSAAMNAGFVDDDIPKHVALFNGNAYDRPYSDTEMNLLYNVADINISTTFGEGVGLSLIESAACGTTSIAPANSAVPEMLGDTGYLIPNIAHINIALDNNHMRPVVNVGKMVEALEAEYQKWVDNGRRKIVNQAAIDRVQELFLWDDKRKKLSEWLKTT